MVVYNFLEEAMQRHISVMVFQITGNSIVRSTVIPNKNIKIQYCWNFVDRWARNEQ